MKQFLLSFLVAFILLLGGRTSKAQTTLTTGDIAIVRMNEDSPSDGFSFVTLVAIDAGTIIYFTEEGWYGSPSWNGNAEAHLKYTATGTLSAGSVVHIDETATADVFSITGAGGSITFAWGTSNFNLSGGDQILAYQTSDSSKPSSPTFIAGLTMNDGNSTSEPNDPATGWTLSSATTFAGVNVSRLPAGLTNGTNCISVFPDYTVLIEKDNARYNCTLTNGTKTALLAAINNHDNWVYDDVTNYATSSVCSFTVTSGSPEMDVQGNGTSIIDGDATPSTSDHTDFGSVAVASGTVVRTFTILNTGTGSLVLNGTPIVAVSGSSDFTVTTQPTSPVAATSGSVSFQVTFDPSASGTRSASLSIANNDTDENPYNFSIQGVGTAPEPEIKISGNSVEIADGDATPSTSDHTDFGFADISTGSVAYTFTIENQGLAALTLSGTPKVSVGGSNPSDFSVIVQPSSPIAISGSTTFQVTFNPTSTGARSATLSITNDDTNENPYDFAIQGYGTSQNLVAGDIAFIGYNSDDPDGFSFVALTDIPAYEMIYFTEEGWNGSAWSGSPDETHYSWHAPSGGLSIGSIVYIYESSANVLTASSGTMSGLLTGTNFYYNTGDQVLAYQSGSGVDPASPTFIAGLHSDYNSLNYNSTTTWSASALSSESSLSTVPTGLTNGQDCVSLYPATTENDNAKYTGTLTGTSELIRLAINTYTNWNSKSDTYYDISSTGYATPSITYSPEMNVQGNSTTIADGDATPSSADYTDFGTANVTSGTVSRTFTILNTGMAELTLSGTPKVSVSGANLSDFTVTAQPASPVAATSGTTTFTVQFDPSGTGIRTATLSIANNDANENPYDFSIQGTGLITPSVTSISPTSGPTAGGTSVVITGTNLTGATAVSFGGTAATGYTVNSATQITATSPAKSAGTIDVTVTTSGGTSATSASDQFTYIAAPSATTNAATSVTSTGATLNGSINANNANTTVTFEYGLTTGYGTSVTAVESPVTGSSATSVSKAITGLSASTTYHFRIKGVNAGGTTNGSDQTFTTSAAGPTIAYGVNLVLNGDAETNSLANWTNSGPVFVALSPSGSGVSNSPSGGYAFDYYPGSASGNESLSQIIDITSLATDIDAGIVKAVLSGEVKKFHAASNCILRVQELDASNALLHTSEVDGITSGDVWLTGNVTVANLNTNTRKLKVILYAQVSTNTDDYIEFDNIQLVLFRPPTLTTTTVSTYSATSATLGGNVTTNGGTTVTERGIVYSLTDATPTIAEGATKVAIGSGTGSFSQSVGSLTSGTLYYVNAFATNSAGTSYGTVTSFTTTAAAPTVSSVSVPSDATYIAGQNLDFTVNYSEAITVTGTPYIPITLNTGGTVNASYVSGSGTTALVFRYTVASGNLDNDGVSVGTAITANGGTLKNGSSTDANLTLNSIGNTTGVLIDAVAPTISSVSSTTANGIYINGDVISITVTFSEAVTVTGTPTLALNSGGTASYFSGSGTTTLTFTYTVGVGQSSTDLDYSATSSLSLAGGTIKDAAGNDATLTLPTVGGASSLGGQKDIVIGIVPIITTQSVSSITSTSATGNGNITDLGYPNPSAYGICWNTTGTPTTADNKVDKGAASATGAFTGSITGLLANTTYYVRAYATNDVETVYGNEVTFTTLQSSNLLENPGAELDYTSWTKTDGGSGWGIDGSAYSGSKDWASSYRTCTLSQTVDLIAKGYAAADLDLSIPIYAKAYVATNSFMGGQATVKVELLNASDGVMNTYYVCNENLATNLPWTKKETLISGYSSGLRKVRYTISGVSNTSWAGQYGPRFDETELSFKKVTTKPATQLELTSATLNSTVFTLGLSSTVKFEYGTTSGVYTESVDVTDISGTSANVNVSGLNQGTTYYVRAVMTNSAGTFYGDQISFRTKIPLTIGNPVISSKEYDGNTTATVSTLGTLSGIEGTDDVSVSPTAVFDTKDVGSTVTVTVSYTLNGTNKDKYEAPVNSVVYTGEITKAMLTVTADVQSKVYGDANPTLTFQYSGWKNGEGESVIDTKPTTSTTVDLLSNVGTHTNSITVSGGADNNYSFTYVPANLTVTASTLTVTADVQSKVYGDANPTLTFQYSGWKNGEGESVIDTKPTTSTTVDLLSNVGTHTNSITVSGGIDNNYSFAYVPADFTITASTLTVTADDQSKVYGDANPTLTFQYSGWKNSDTETVLDTKPTTSTTVDLLSNVGTHTNSLTVSGGADNNYSFTYVPANFTITASTLTVTADAQTKIYGDANPTLTFQYSGWKNGEDESVLDTKPTVSTTVDLLSNVGTHTNSITVSGGADNNYSFTHVPANLTVTASTLTVTADAKSKVYGDANPTLTFQYSGWKNSDDETVLDTKPAASTTVDLLSNVGTYTNSISVSGGIDNNYSFTYVPANLTVTTSTLTVTADGQTKAYGDANPTLTFQYSGWKNSDTETVLDTKPTTSTTVDLLSNVGTHTNSLTVSGGADNNYSFTYVPANFTITASTLTVTADAQTKIYGDANPTLTFQYSGWKNGEDESVLDTKPTVSTTVSITTTTGTYPNAITVSGGLDNNYDFTYVSASFTVGKGKLIAWLDPKTKEYGQENPVLTYRYTGFMNGDDESTLDSKPHPTTKVTKSTDAGTYTNSISMVGGLDDKYIIFDVPANFTVTKATQFITFNTLAPKTYGDHSFNLDATTNSGLTLSYTCSNTDVAVVSGSTVSITGAGTAMITVSQPGNNNYLAAETVSQTLTVNKKLLFVEGIEAESKVYDGNANAVLTGGTLTGTVDSDVIMVSIATTGTFSQTSIGTAIPVSTDMTISGENAANYVLSSPILRADIIAKTVTVTAQNAGRVCDEQEQVLAYTFEPALIDGDTFTGKLARTAGTAPGVYPISQGNLSLGTNYTINFTGAAYTIANAKNLAPVVDLVNDLKVSKNSKEATVILTGIDPVSNCIAQEIESIIATAENTTLIPEVQVDYIKCLSTAKLKIKIADELTGETTIRVKLKDNGGTENGGVDTKEFSFTIKVEIPTGVDDLSQGVEAIIYPNPSNGLIHIETSGFVNPFVRIFKVTGEEILKKTNLTELVQAINLKGNSPGLYFVEIGDKQKNVTKKLIIKK